MAITRSARILIMTAAADTVNYPVKCSSIRLVGTGATPGARLLIRQRGAASGAILVDHYVQNANEDADVFFSGGDGEWIDRPYIDTIPANCNVYFRVL